MPKIAELGHVGFHVFDLGLEAAFYTNVLGLEATDGSVGDGYVFLSSRPTEEHHELLLIPGRTAPKDLLLVQQISFRCGSYEDLTGYLQRFRDAGVEIDMTVSHGNAIGIYFFDPEGNRMEVYWHTGHTAKQGFLQHLDLTQPKEAVLAQVEESVQKYGRTGYLESDANERLDVPSDPPTSIGEPGSTRLTVHAGNA